MFLGPYVLSKYFWIIEHGYSSMDYTLLLSTKVFVSVRESKREREEKGSDWFSHPSISIFLPEVEGGKIIQCVMLTQQELWALADFITLGMTWQIPQSIFNMLVTRYEEVRNLYMDMQRTFKNRKQIIQMENDWPGENVGSKLFGFYSLTSCESIV